jgi:hypothetical protein
LKKHNKKKSGINSTLEATLKIIDLYESMPQHNSPVENWGDEWIKIKNMISRLDKKDVEKLGVNLMAYLDTGENDFETDEYLHRNPITESLRIIKDTIPAENIRLALLSDYTKEHTRIDRRRFFPKY